jgi:hypothetical protein
VVTEALESDRSITGPPPPFRDLDELFLPDEFRRPACRTALAWEYRLEDWEYVQLVGSWDKKAGGGALGSDLDAERAAAILADSSCFSSGDFVKGV